MVFGASMIVIQQVCKIKNNQMQSLSPILHRISLQIPKFEVVDFFHI